MDKWLSPDDVVALVPGITRGQLAQRRYRGLPPAFSKPSQKTVIYAESDVVEWIREARKTQSGKAA